MKNITKIVAFITQINYAQVGFGVTTPNGVLDITSADNGLLAPRLALSATNVATVLTPTVSELVYNTFTSAAGANQVYTRVLLLEWGYGLN